MASGEMSKPEFIAFLTQFISPMIPHLKDGAVFDICMDWRHLGELLAAIAANDLSLINLCVWNKTNGGMGSLYRSKHELVLIAKKGTAPHTNNVELGKHGRYRTNVWDYAGVNTFGKGRMADLADHPTVKPVALVELMKLWRSAVPDIADNESEATPDGESITAADLATLDAYRASLTDEECGGE